MSADNWTLCPRCLKTCSEEWEKYLAETRASYGKVPASDYIEAIAKAEKPLRLEDTFREDYEIGITKDGKFIVSYGGSCERCGFKHEFKHEKQLKP